MEFPIDVEELFNLENYPTPKPSYVPRDWKEGFDHVDSFKGHVPIYWAGDGNKIILCLHGGSYSALSFVPMVIHLKEKYSVGAYDLRGHGGSTLGDKDDSIFDDLEDDKYNTSDLTLGTLVKDCKDVLNDLAEKFIFSPIVLVGHSLGGAIAAKAVAEAGGEKYQKNLSGLIILDTAEEKALASIEESAQNMETWPKKFASVDEAIGWVFESKIVLNSHSARLSIPGCVKPIKGGAVHMHKGRQLQETKWRTDLLSYKPLWSSWFEGFTSNVLSCSVPVLFLMSNMDHLDARLMDKVDSAEVPETGHMIHEDRPDEVAKVIDEWMTEFVQEYLD